MTVKQINKAEKAEKAGKADNDATQRESAGVIKSAKRVLELFEFFAEQRRPLGVNDIVQGLNYPQSSSSALLKSLTKLGYLDYDRYSRQYMPTLRVAMIGGWVHDRLFSHSSLSAIIDELHVATGGLTVIMGKQNDIYAQYIYLVQSITPVIPWYVKPGSLRSLCRSAVGKVLLSRKSDVEVQQLVWRTNAEEPDVQNHVRVSELIKELDAVRQQRYAVSLGALIASAGVIAVEIPTPASQPPMAIGIAGPVSEIAANQERLLAILNEALLPYRSALAPRSPT
jgi:DNA-binding IclR family transcriptional regulator